MQCLLTMISRSLIRLRGDETGATSIEYGLLASLIAIALIQALDSLGTAVTDTFDTTREAMAAADEPSTPGDEGPT